MREVREEKSTGDGSRVKRKDFKLRARREEENESKKRRGK